MCAGLVISRSGSKQVMFSAMPILHKGKGGGTLASDSTPITTIRQRHFNARPGGGARGVQRVSAAAMYPTNVPLLLPSHQRLR